MAETAPQVELDPEGKRLQLEQLKAEFRQKAAEANAARLKASLPGGSTAPVAGEVKVGADAGTSLASVVAADKLSAAAKAIATALKEPTKGRPIIIVEDRGVALSDLVLFDVQSSIAAMDSLLDDVEASLPPVAPDGGPLESLDGGGGEGGDAAAADAGAGEGGEGGSGGGAASSAGGPLGLVGDVIGMLRSDYQVQNVAVHVDRLTLLAEVVRLLGPDAKVILPTIAMIADAPILTEARTLIVRRTRLARRVDAVENLNVDPVASRIAATQAHLVQLQAAQDKLVADGDKKADNLLPSIAAEKAAIAADLSNGAYQRARATVDSAKVSLTAFDTLFATIATAPAGGSAPLAQAALRQQIRVLSGDQDPGLLWLDVTASGGDVVTKKSPLGWNSEVSFLGAVQTVYLLAASSGTLLASGAATKFGYRTWDFDNFFGDSRSGSMRQLRDLTSDLAEPLVVILVLAVVLALLLRVFP